MIYGIKEVVHYWIITAESDKETMNILFKNGKYSYTLYKKLCQMIK